MTEQKRILILTADAGFGHRSAANAVSAALQERYGGSCVVDIVNPLDDKRLPAFIRESQSDYDKLILTAPKLYNLGYDLSDSTTSAAVVDSVLTLMLFEVLYHLVRHVKPDAIVTTYPLYQAPLKVVGQLLRHHVPLCTVVTDLGTVHALWFHDYADWCLVPTEAVRALALKHGLLPDKVEITGIPVHPNLLHAAGDRTDLRISLGWRTDVTTILVVGSKRVGYLRDVLRILNHAALPVQLIVVTGGDDALFAELQTVEWHAEVRLYNFVDNLPTMMHAADCIICKAGGLIISEALAVGLPLVLIDVLPGQEVGNAEHVIRGAAGEWAHDPIAALETLYHWLDHDKAQLAEYAARAGRLGHPQAAYAVASRIWAAADLNVHTRNVHQSGSEHSRLVGWLRLHNLRFTIDS